MRDSSDKLLQPMERRGKREEREREREGDEKG